MKLPTDIIEGKQKFTMVGFLADRADIVIVKSNQMMLRITPCTDYPDSIDPTNLPPKINVFVNHNSLYYEDDESDDEESRIDSAYREFQNKWFVSTPNFAYNEDRQRLFVTAYDAHVTAQNSEFDLNTIKLIEFPIYESTHEHNRPITQYEFEKALIAGKVVGNNPLWPSNANDVPRGIIWRNTTTSMSLYTNIQSQTNTPTGFSYASDNRSFRRVALGFDDSEWQENFIEFEGIPIAYVPSDVFLKYEKQAASFTPEKSDANGDTLVVQSIQTTRKPIDAPSEASTDKADVSSSIRSRTTTSDKQGSFIMDFQRQTQQMGLHYDLRDLINFHTAMESDGLVILSGLSGTGKSQLVRAYAKALGLIIGDSQSSQSSKKLCFVPVRPFWADDSDLLGYADMVNNVYRPGDSGLVDTLVSANEHKDQLFIVVFDEMNLARVEHYFSQFLSVLEMPLSSRYIRLYNSQLKTRLYNSQQYPDHIAIRDNVLFVGTVNTDESTFQFSDKVLDRSNVISLHILPFNKEYKVADETAISSEQDELTTSEYRALANQDDKKPLTQKEKSLLWDLHVTLNEEDRNLGIGWRIVHQIDSFVRNLPEIDDGVSRGEAIDLQLVQRILTKVRGSQEQLHDLLGTGKEPGKLIRVLDKYTDISTFEQSRLLLTQKTRELTLYGFTM